MHLDCISALSSFKEMTVRCSWMLRSFRRTFSALSSSIVTKAKSLFVFWSRPSAISAAVCDVTAQQSGIKKRIEVILLSVLMELIYCLHFV